MKVSPFVAAVFAFLILGVFARALAAEDEFERPPISYSRSTPDNPVERLQARIDAGESRLRYEETLGSLYFNDDAYVGYVHDGEVVELSVADTALGTVFYTLDQTVAERPRFVRQTDDCLLCHGGSQTRGVPGRIIRSVYPDRTAIRGILAATKPGTPAGWATP
jgi:hypothetical protein